MIIGIGCDIVKISRIDTIFKRYGVIFLNKILTLNEISVSNSKNNSLIRYLAKRFAAKEAYAKATGLGIKGEISFKSIEILNDKNNSPFFNKHPLNDVSAFLSISDEVDYAIAYVILEKT